MGAPGEAFFCDNGHLFHWTPEHLYWTDEMFDESDKIKNDGCFCGSKEVTKISHYGGINDCVCLSEEEDTKGVVITDKIDEFLAPASNVLDKDGNPVKGCFYRVHLPVYHIPEDVKDGSRWK